MSDDQSGAADRSALRPAELGVEAQRRALAAYEERDWRGIYDWTKAWISSGGGAWIVDAWLLYVVSALLHRQPRTAVHSVDLALANWIEASEERALLRWVRASIVHRRLEDPKTAQADYEAAAGAVPDWLRERVERDVVECAADAARSRKRKASVVPAPDFKPGERGFVAPRTTVSKPGSIPAVWPQLLESLGAAQ
jgi:hypothetical protein